MTLDFLKKEISVAAKTVYFDQNDFLREKSNDPTLLRKTITLIEAHLNCDSVTEDKRDMLVGTLGNFYRIIGEPIHAIKLFNSCLNQSVNQANPHIEIVSLIRLGEALKYNNQHQDALNRFNIALKKCRLNQIDKYKDFVLQHKGKCLMELNRLNEAEQCFEAALNLRLKKEDPTLIHSTNLAIELVRSINKEK
ncbi:hypothetical protein [Pseudalkalibacillus berkeleyi]|uniref:Tetratricopeptide repeat protein n=1 Tax=Pseudalkalibacillus berkeleyi TaxID=1069813 RepID=A0ABS9GVC6_9BACL|nr:hypothetical protein [Pseudalkalibacillus berkeleyi]MCF6136644.1 hypothetical protein [Pseudalkalibacillus berkeleyi]